jgi:hypothetical protein
MPVKTRSQHRAVAADATVAVASRSARSVKISGDARHPANIRIKTPSFLESCKRTYKVYSPQKKVRQSQHNNNNNNDDDEIELSITENDAIESLLALQEYDDHEEQEQEREQEQEQDQEQEHDHDEQHDEPKEQEPSPASLARCMNSMTPITKYIYRIGVYNINQTVHYKTAYILYDPKSRLFHIHTVISNSLKSDEQEDKDRRTEINETGWYSLPLPINTLQTKYATFINETAVNFVNTMIIPSDEHDYYIQDDILGLVISNDEFREKAFSDDSSYYDIEKMIYDETSTETTNGFKAYMLVPSRNFWYSPFGAYYTTVSIPETWCKDKKYTTDVIESVLLIMSQSN